MLQRNSLKGYGRNPCNIDDDGATASDYHDLALDACSNPMRCIHNSHRRSSREANAVSHEQTTESGGCGRGMVIRSPLVGSKVDATGTSWFRHRWGMHVNHKASVTNDAPTWELVLAKTIPGGSVYPASAMLAPKGGCDNLCDDDERYTDTCEFQVSGDVDWLLVRTEDRQWSFPVLQQGFH